MFGEEVSGFLWFVLVHDADPLYVWVDLGGLDQVGMLELAGATPGGPEVEHDPLLSDVVGQADLVALEVDEVEHGGLLALERIGQKGARTAIIWQQYHLLFQQASGFIELYDMEQDPKVNRNLFGKNKI